jgi:hypothetical protein
MTPSALHRHVKKSVNGVVSARHDLGLRLLLESGSTEGFLRDLLAIQLTTSGETVVRELPIGPHHVDLVLSNCGSQGDTFIETKQLLLNGGARYVKNVLNDLKRHDRNLCLGVVYIVDRSHSKTPFLFKNDASATNHKDKLNLIFFQLQKVFPCVYPTSPTQALLQRFTGDGYVDLYAFVVSLLEDVNPALPT